MTVDPISPSRHEPEPRELVRNYTLALGVAAALLALGSVSLYSMADDPSLQGSMAWAFVLSARINLGLALCVAFVVCLRVRKSEFALGATTLCSVLLVLFFPFGTVVFLYWLFSVRTRERGAPGV